jgi:WD40 repeat protein
MFIITISLLILISTPAYSAENKLHDHDQKISTAAEVVRHQLPAWVKESRRNLIQLLDKTCKLPTVVGNIIVDMMGDCGYGTWFPQVTINNTIKHERSMCIVTLPHGGFAVTSGSENDTIKVYDADGNLQHTLLNGAEVSNFSACLDGAGIAVNSTNGSINLWKLTSNKEAQLRRKFSQLLSKRQSHQNQFLELQPHRLVIARHDALQLWDTQDKRCLATGDIGRRQQIRTPLIKLSTGNIAACCKDTLYAALYTGRMNWHIILWNTTTQAVSCIQNVHDREIAAMVALPYGLLATASSSYSSFSDSLRDKGIIKVWDTETTQLLHTLRSYRGTVHALCALLNNTLASGAYGAIDVWSPTTGARVRTVRDHTMGLVRALLELPCGRLAAGGNNITIWDVVQGVCLQTLSGHWESVKTLKVLSDGKLLSADKAGKITIWNSAINPEEFRSKKSEKPQKSQSHCRIS